MGAIEDAVDAAANFIGPFLDKDSQQDEKLASRRDNTQDDQLVHQALSHLQNINAAERAADPNAPYDASLAGIVYGLLDLITSLGILPYLSTGVAFSQRPRSVLLATISRPSSRNLTFLSNVLNALIPILEQDRTGVQPLLSQRLLPDIISALAELAFSPDTSHQTHAAFEGQYNHILSSTPTSRLLPILTSFLQQDLKPWLKQRLSKELVNVPLRSQGVRHTIEYLSLSYLSQNSQVPQDASGPQSQIPIPLEAITQASRLLVSVPSGMEQDDWFTQLAPQIWNLLDGNEGKELSRAAGQIIAGGILNRKATGAPGTIGWELFGQPLIAAIYPKSIKGGHLRLSTTDEVVVDEQYLQLALKRLSIIASSYSHAGLTKRLIGPLLLPLWGLLNFTRARPSLDKQWTEFPRMILSRYMAISCDPKQIEMIMFNLFWDGELTWTFGPGSQGGVEIRQRRQDSTSVPDMGSILARIGDLDERVNLFVTMLADANIEDAVAGAIFIKTTRRWLTPAMATKQALTNEPDIDPLSALADAKLSEAMATKFKDKFARSPQHIIELMAQLLQNFVNEHQTKCRNLTESKKLTRAALGNLVKTDSSPAASGSDSEAEDLASFALSILATMVASPDFKHNPEITMLFNSVEPPLRYLSQSHHSIPLPPLVTNLANNLIHILTPVSQPVQPTNPLTEHRATLQTVLKDLTSPEPPNRTWALTTLRKLILGPTSFPLLDVPSTTHLLLSASLSDPESYVHMAAIPVVVDLCVRAPNPTLRILVDAFIDIDERSIKLRKEKEIEQALDFRLRVGEVLSNLVLNDGLWTVTGRYASLKMITEATLGLASRRGQRRQTLMKRNDIAVAERKEQEEGEAAWGGPIPNLLDPDGNNPAEQQERDALLKIVQGWEDTGIEEDVRIRASALSILGTVMEKRLELLNQLTVDASLQIVLLILTIETGEAKGILRRAAVLIVMGLLRGMNSLLEDGKEGTAGLGMKQTSEVERVMQWIRDEDGDGLVRDHAASVIEGLETWRMKRVYKLRDDGIRLGPDLGLEGNIRGLNVSPLPESGQTQMKPLIFEEIE